MKNEDLKNEEYKPTLDQIVSEIQDIILEPFSWIEIVIELFSLLTLLSLIYFFTAKSLAFLLLIWLSVSSIGYYLRYKKSSKMIRKYYEDNYNFN